MKLSACAWIFSAMAMCTVYAQQQPAPDTTAGQQQTQTRTIQMAPARATLNHGLDAKKAKQGDAVTAKLQDDVKIADAPELPKNTVLMGHVDQVQPSEHKSDSVIQVTFDKAQLKGGQQVPIKATVMQIALPVNAMMMGQDAGGGSSGAPMASPSMPSSAPSSGGSAGSGSGTQTSSAPPPTPSPSMGSAPVPDQMQQSQQQGVPGVELKSDIHQQDSATFTSKGKNVHLPDGTQMQIAVAVVPPNTQIK
ncbi:MAG TPA: hypothetical protein VFA02_13085 [Pseudacidobacterium sp.]|nr:hypothetical protein [Pseudacidobacterium sp.]